MNEALPLEIDVSTLHSERSSGQSITILDIREPHEILISALPDSLNIRMAEIPNKLDQIPTQMPLYVLCRSGARSMQVTQFLRAHGFDKAQNVAGGINAWAQIIDTSMPLY
jgi:rhodanese-related sulfurtransferase